jgi:hypothetical protein
MEHGSLEDLGGRDKILYITRNCKKFISKEFRGNATGHKESEKTSLI